MSKIKDTKVHMRVEDIDKQLDSLLKKIKNLDKYLINIGAPHKDVNIDIFEIKRKAMRLEFAMDYFDFSSDIQPGSSGKSGFPIQRRKLNRIKNYIELIGNYNDLILQHKQKKRLDIIALLGLIFAPLSIITGYFGMNFQRFGGPATTGLSISQTKQRGVLTYKHPHIFSFILFVASAIIMMVLYYYFNKPVDSDLDSDSDSDSKN
mgnify:CR=1 FL=1